MKLWAGLLAVVASAAMAQEPGTQPESSGASETPPAESAPAADSTSTPESTPAPAAEPSTEPAAQTAQPETVPTIPVAKEEPAAPANATQLEDVVVTAGRRLQKIDKVALAVSEVSGPSIEAAGVRDTQSLVMVVPSLNIQYSGSEATSTIRIRGVGTGGSNPGFESSVGVFVDGVYLPRPGLALNDLMDIDHVEVLRGPQGTLFGKNTTVGAIQILTREPNLFVTEGDLSAGMGNYSAKLVRGTFGMPVIDGKFGVRLAAQMNQRDGYVLNTYNGEHYNDRDRYAVRGQALWKPAEDLSLRLILSTIRKHEHCCVAPFTQYNPAAADDMRAHGGTVFDPPAEYEVAFDYTDTHSNSGEDSGSLHVEWDLGEIKVKGIGSYAKGSIADKRDGDFSDVDFAYQPFVNAQTKIYTGETSVQGRAGIVDWLGGVFYSNEKVGAQAQTLLGEDAGSYLFYPAVQPHTPNPDYPAGTGNLPVSYQDGQSYSAFTHNVIDLPWNFESTLGLRYLIEKKQGGGYATTDSPSCNAPLIPGGTIPSEPGVGDPGKTSNSLRSLCGADPYFRVYDDKRFTGTAALARNFDIGLYAYLSYSQGFKSGGINLNPPSTAGGTFMFKPETVKNYEGGVRFSLFGGALSNRITYFVMDLRNYQLNTFDGTAFSVSNAGQVDGKGVEVEEDLRLPWRMGLRMNYTLIDTRYGDATLDPTLIGKQLTNSPKHVGQLSLIVAPSSQPYSMFGSVAVRYQSYANTGVDLDPAKDQGAYMLLNGRVGMKLPSDYDVSFTGTNLTQQYYNQIIFNAIMRPPATTSAAAQKPGSYNGYPGNPRMFMLELRKRF